MFFFQIHISHSLDISGKFASNKKNNRIFDANRGLTGSVDINDRFCASVGFNQSLKHFMIKWPSVNQHRNPSSASRLRQMSWHSGLRPGLHYRGAFISADPYLRHYSCYCPARPFELSPWPDRTKNIPMLIVQRAMHSLSNLLQTGCKQTQLLEMWPRSNSNSTTFKLRTFSTDSKFDECFKRFIVDCKFVETSLIYD